MSDDAESISSEHPNKLVADLCMLCVATIWGLNMPIMKFALARVDEFLFNAMRLFVSAIVLAAIVWWQKARILNRAADASPIRRQILMIVVFAFLSGFAYQVLFLLGINETTAGNTALIMSALPMWTALLATVLINEKLNRLAWVGLLIAFLGTLVVTLTIPGSENSQGSLWGNLLVSGATFSWALGSVWSRPMMKEISPLGLAFCGVAIAVPFHFLVAHETLHEMHLFLQDPWLLAALLFSGGFSTGRCLCFLEFWSRNTWYVACCCISKSSSIFCIICQLDLDIRDSGMASIDWAAQLRLWGLLSCVEIATRIDPTDELANLIA